MLIKCAFLVILVLSLQVSLLGQVPNSDNQEVLYTPLTEFIRSSTLDRGFSIEGRNEEKKEVYLRFEAYAPDLIRIRMSLEPIVERPSYILARTEWDEIPCELEEDKEKLNLRTSEINVFINKNPIRFVAYDSLGGLIIREHGAFGMGTGNVYGTLRTKLRETIDIPSWRDEALFGLGQKFGRLDKKGSVVRIWNTDGFLSRNDNSAVNVPFFMHTKGYGIFVNSFGDITYRLGTESNEYYTIEVEDTVLDFFLIVGPSFKKIIRRYTELTGRSPIPPRWAFGIWFSKDTYGTQADVRAVCKEMREKNLPCDVINIDQNFWASAYNDFQWNENFPNPKAMIQTLKELGYKICLWESPIVNIATAGHRLPVVENLSINYGEGVGRDYFLKRIDGTVYNVEWDWGTGALVDFTNPEAAAWWRSFHKPLVEMGIDAFKIDNGELVPRDAVFSNGMTGAQMHNVYSLLYSKTIFEAINNGSGSKAIIWSRSGYAGSQRYPFLESGQQAPTFEYLPAVIRAGQSIGLSGIPLWSHTIGGSQGTPSRECYIRWVQLGMLSPITVVHGSGDREPWKFGKEALEIYRQYAELRMQLFPYLYSYAYIAHKTGLPIMRAMALEFQDDLVSQTMDLQYFLGRELLVAPIYSQFNRRTVYLPEGKWHDYWTGEIFTGPQVMAVAAPLNQIPLFVRNGAIIPMAPSMNYIDEKPIGELTLDIYPGENSSFEMYDDSVTVVFSCSTVAKRVFIDLQSAGKSFVLKVNENESPWQVSLDDEILPRFNTLQDYEKATVGWFFFDIRKSYTGIKIPREKVKEPVMIILERK